MMVYPFIATGHDRSHSIWISEIHVILSETNTLAEAVNQKCEEYAEERTCGACKYPYGENLIGTK